MDKPKILIVDTYYPDFLKSLPEIPPDSAYTVELKRLMEYGFGTADFYSHHLRAEGWDVLDVIANYTPLQLLWTQHNGRWSQFGNPQAVVLEQIKKFEPDVVFMQDLSFFDADTLKQLRSRYYLAGQCSCPMPRPDKVEKFNLLFTSFPHYVRMFESINVSAQYLPLAFDPRMRPAETERDLDISFVGGIGRNSHWKAGTDMMEAVAVNFPEQFHWYGYGLENLSADSPLRSCYCGSAFGKEMYSIYGRSKIVINRHGEVAAGFANNLRMYEATGCGAMLMTEDAPNLLTLFPFETVSNYLKPADVIPMLRWYLDEPENRERVAAGGQAQTLKHHTYSSRIKIVSDVLYAKAIQARQGK